MAENEIVFAAHQLLITEKIIDGQVRICCEMAGDGVNMANEDPDRPASVGYLLLATVMNLFLSGYLFEEMGRQFSVDPPGEIEIKQVPR